MKIEIRSRLTGSVLFEGDFSCIADAVKTAVARSADLSYANLSSADLSYANLRSADLSSADLSAADLRYANLRSANLRSADLSSADLSSADLSSADLSSADLRSADLSSADLSSAAHSWAQVAFMGHGECGRMLTAIQIKKTDKPAFFCGCFTGNEQSLRKYIADGDARLRETRTLAVDTVLTLLNAKNED